MKKFLITIIQLNFLIDSTKQSKIRQATVAFKAIGNIIKNPLLKTIGNTIKKPIIKTFGNTIKNSVGTFHRKKSTIKILACGLVDKQPNARHNFASKSVKYLGEVGIKKLKYIVPQAARQGKKPMQMRSAEWMRGNNLRPLIKMLSESKSQTPFLFAGGLMSFGKFNLVPKNNSFLYELDEDSVDSKAKKSGISQHKITMNWDGKDSVHKQEDDPNWNTFKTAKQCRAERKYNIFHNQKSVVDDAIKEVDKPEPVEPVDKDRDKARRQESKDTKKAYAFEIKKKNELKKEDMRVSYKTAKYYRQKKREKGKVARKEKRDRKRDSAKTESHEEDGAELKKMQDLFKDGLEETNQKVSPRKINKEKAIKKPDDNLEKRVGETKIEKEVDIDDEEIDKQNTRMMKNKNAESIRRKKRAERAKAQNEHNRNLAQAARLEEYRLKNEETRLDPTAKIKHRQQEWIGGNMKRIEDFYKYAEENPFVPDPNDTTHWTNHVDEFYMAANANKGETIQNVPSQNVIETETAEGSELDDDSDASLENKMSEDFGINPGSMMSEDLETSPIDETSEDLETSPNDEMSEDIDLFADDEMGEDFETSGEIEDSSDIESSEDIERSEVIKGSKIYGTTAVYDIKEDYELTEISEPAG